MTPGARSVHPSTIRAFRARLLGWYGRTRRDLPWRHTRDPYRIWVSEIMLQQTQVAKVLPYYARFVDRFPNLESLARARLSSVLKVWEGLGFYRRARDLHATARLLVRAGGGIPRELRQLRALPGIGAYTAAAVASIAWGLPAAVVDGNVARVLCRLFLVADPPRTGTARKRLEQLAGELLPKREPGDFNQAMMELGAVCCTPRRPGCATCPVKALCGARREGRQNELPRPAARTPRPHYDVVAAVIRKDERLLIARRKEEGLLGGLWEFPGGKVETGETHRQALRREIREELDITVEVGEHLLSVKHAYSHFRITLHTYACRYRGGRPRAVDCAAWKWIHPADLDRYAFPKADREIIRRLRESDGHHVTRKRR